MLRILLIRHATTDPIGTVLYGRLPDIHINAEGRNEASALARGLRANYRLAEVVSSPMERALETSAVIAAECGVPVTEDRGLLEVDFGAWMGQTFAQLRTQEDWRLYNQTRSTTRPPGGESILEVQDRAWRCLCAIASRFSLQSGATVAAVSHGDIIRGLLLLLLGMSADLIHRLEIAPASLSEVLLGDDDPRVIRINQSF